MAAKAVRLIRSWCRVLSRARALPNLSSNDGSLIADQVEGIQDNFNDIIRICVSTITQMGSLERGCFHMCTYYSTLES